MTQNPRPNKPTDPKVDEALENLTKVTRDAVRSVMDAAKQAREEVRKANDQEKAQTRTVDPSGYRISRPQTGRTPLYFDERLVNELLDLFKGAGATTPPRQNKPKSSFVRRQVNKAVRAQHNAIRDALLNEIFGVPKPTAPKPTVSERVATQQSPRPSTNPSPDAPKPPRPTTPQQNLEGFLNLDNLVKKVNADSFFEEAGNYLAEGASWVMDTFGGINPSTKKDTSTNPKDELKDTKKETAPTKSSAPKTDLLGGFINDLTSGLEGFVNDLRAELDKLTKERGNNKSAPKDDKPAPKTAPIFPKNDFGVDDDKTTNHFFVVDETTPTKPLGLKLEMQDMRGHEVDDDWEVSNIIPEHLPTNFFLSFNRNKVALLPHKEMHTDDWELRNDLYRAFTADDDFPLKFKDALFRYAWVEGHQNHTEIRRIFNTLAPIVLAAYTTEFVDERFDFTD